MSHGVQKSKRPSGAQERKAKGARKKGLKTLAGSMLQYVKRLDDVQDSSKDTAPQSPIDERGSSDARMHSTEERGVEKAEFEAEKQGVKMEESEAEESGDSDSGHDTVSEVSDIQEKEPQILCDVSFWEIPVPDHIRIEIVKRGSASFQNKDGPFSDGARLDAKGHVRQLSREWFYQMTPNGEKTLRSWMVYSLASKNLYCFCCRLFAVSAKETTSQFVTGFQTWQKLSPKVYEHETSKEHLRCLKKWKTLAAGLRLHKTIDTLLWVKS